MLELLDESPEAAAADAQTVMRIDTALATDSMTRGGSSTLREISGTGGSRRTKRNLQRAHNASKISTRSTSW
jgi:hypothetical protein